MDSNVVTSLLTLNEACGFLKIKKSRLRTAIFRKEIPFIKIGRLIRFDHDDLKAWLIKLKANTT